MTDFLWVVAPLFTRVRQSTLIYLSSMVVGFNGSANEAAEEANNLLQIKFFSTLLPTHRMLLMRAILSCLKWPMTTTTAEMKKG